MKRSMVMLVILVMGMILGSGCLSSLHQVKNLSCEQTYVVPVFDYNNKLLVKYTSPIELKSEFRRNPDDGLYYEYPVNVDEWRSFFDPINERINTLNHGLDHIYLNGNLLKGPQVRNVGLEDYTQAFDGGYDTLWSDMCHESVVDMNELWRMPYKVQLYIGKRCEPEDGLYCANSTFGDDGLVFVEVLTPNGSQANYFYPSKWLDQILMQSFGEGEEFEFDPSYITPDAMMDAAKYQQKLVDILLGVTKDKEVGYVNFFQNDFEGRTVLTKVMLKMMQIASVSNGGDVSLVFQAKMSTQQKAITTLSMTQDGFDVRGWMALSFGSVSGGGGGVDLDYSYTASMEDVTSGSLYVIVP